MYAALTKGLNFKITMGNILTLTPPLTINEAEMNAALDILQESLHEVFAR
jgi:4-aminobutyrate aminotransferase